MLANRDVVDRAFESSCIDVDFTPKFLVHALFGLGADVLEQRLVVGKITANEAALRHIDALGRNGEKLNIGTSGRTFTFLIHSVSAMLNLPFPALNSPSLLNTEYSLLSRL